MDPRVKEKLAPIKARLASSDSDERRWAIYDLEAFDAADTIDLLVTGILDENRAVREAASEVLEAYDPDKCTRSLVPLLGSERIEVRNITASVLVKYGQSAVKDLISALVDPNEDVRKFSADILGLARNPEAVPDLCKSALEDEVKTVAVSSVEALGKIGDPSALPALYEIFDRHQGMEPEAIEAIGLIGGADSVDYLANRLDQDDPVITFAIIDAFGNLGDPTALEPLQKFLKSAQDFLKEHITLSILKIGQSGNHKVLDQADPHFLESMFNALKTGDEEIIALVLHQFTLGMDNNVIDAFFHNIKELPSNITVGLIRHATAYDKYTEAIKELVKHEDDWVAYSALEAFESVPREEAAVILSTVLKEYTGIRLLAAMRIIEALALKELEAEMMALLETGQEDVRMEVQRILDTWK